MTTHTTGQDDAPCEGSDEAGFELSLSLWDALMLGRVSANRPGLRVRESAALPRPKPTCSEPPGGRVMTTDLVRDIERRERETADTRSRVIDRMQPPSPFPSYTEYAQALADAYEARGRFWEELIDQFIEHRDLVLPRWVLLAALSDAKHGCLGRADEVRRDARQCARHDQDRAFATYADNLTAARVGAVATRSGVAA